MNIYHTENLPLVTPISDLIFDADLGMGSTHSVRAFSPVYHSYTSNYFSSISVPFVNLTYLSFLYIPTFTTNVTIFELLSHLTFGWYLPLGNPKPSSKIFIFGP